MASPVEERVEFTYRLTGFGWSEAVLTVGGRSVRLTASYLSDALGDLLNALVSLRKGARSARVSWEEEPGEYRWLFAREDDLVAVRVLWLDDNPLEPLPDEAGELRLSARCRLETLVHEVASSARALLSEHGEDGYRKQWDQHDFPTALLETLERSA